MPASNVSSMRQSWRALRLPAMADRPFSLGTGPSFHCSTVHRRTTRRRTHATPSGARPPSAFPTSPTTGGSEPAAGVDGGAVLVHAEVQVAAGGVAGGARVADELAAVHRATEL